MRSLILYILVLVFVFSCKQNGNLTPEKPEGLLSEKEMVDVLYDLAILNAAKSTNRKILENNNINPVSYIHEKHNIDSLQFANSNAYYAYDLDLYESLYSQVKIRLEKDSDRIKKLVELDQKRIDSLREERKKERDSSRVRKVKEEIDDNQENEAKLPPPLKNIDTSKQSNRQ